MGEAWPDREAPLRPGVPSALRQPPSHQCVGAWRHASRLSRDVYSLRRHLSGGRHGYLLCLDPRSQHPRITPEFATFPPLCVLHGYQPFEAFIFLAVGFGGIMFMLFCLSMLPVPYLSFSGRIILTL